MLKRLLQSTKRLNLHRKMISLLPSQWRWTLGALTQKAAMQATINTRNSELFDKQGQELAEELKTIIPPDATVLDFGCGLGRPEKFLASHCKQIYGADISAGMLRLARKRHKGIENVHFVKVKKTDLSVFQDSAFDFIFSEAVLQHMDKEHAILILKELLRVCKNGAKVYLMFCNLLCPFNLDNFIKYSLTSKILTPTRMRYWLPEEVERVVQAVGFRTISLDVKNDAHNEKRDCLQDDYHRGYSIWVLASKK